MKRALAASVLVLCVAVSCRTIPIPVIADVPVPAGLSQQQVEISILSGIFNVGPPSAFDPAHEMPRADFDRLVWDEYMRRPRATNWFPESREPGVIYASVSARGHYLKIALKFDTSAIHTDILESQNLMQENGRIHKKAIEWIDNLHIRIRSELARMAAGWRPPPKA